MTERPVTEFEECVGKRVKCVLDVGKLVDRELKFAIKARESFKETFDAVRVTPRSSLERR